MHCISRELFEALVQIASAGQIFRQLGPSLGIGHATVPHGFDKHPPALEKGRHFRSPTAGTGSRSTYCRAHSSSCAAVRVWAAHWANACPVRRTINHQIKNPCPGRLRDEGENRQCEKFLHNLPSSALGFSANCAATRLKDMSRHGHNNLNSQIAASWEGQTLMIRTGVGGALGQTLGQAFLLPHLLPNAMLQFGRAWNVQETF